MTTSSRARRSALARRRDRPRRWDRPWPAVGIATRPGATKRARLSTWPSVWSFIRPRRARPRARSRGRRSSRCSISSRGQAGVAVGVEQALLGGDGTVPVPSPSIAPPSRIQSALADGQRRAARRAARRSSSSPSSSYLPPQPLKPKALRAPALGRAEHDRPGVAQPDVAERLDDDLGERARARARSPRPPSCAATSHTSSPLPPAWTAAANAATSRSAGFRSPSHSSGSLGKPIHTASCGAHSGGGGAGWSSRRALTEPRLHCQAKACHCATDRAQWPCRMKGDFMLRIKEACCCAAAAVSICSAAARAQRSQSLEVRRQGVRGARKQPVRLRSVARAASNCVHRRRRPGGLGACGRSTSTSRAGDSSRS